MKHQIPKDELDDLKEELREQVADLAIKAWPVYKYLKWSWGGLGIPTLRDLKRTLHRHIDSLQPGFDNYHVESGGLRAEYWCEEYKDGDILWSAEISFRIAKYACLDPNHEPKPTI